MRHHLWRYLIYLYVPDTESINDSNQKISDDRLMKCIDYSGMIIDSFRRIGFITSDSFFFLSVGQVILY